jgi:hypothetical protein
MNPVGESLAQQDQKILLKKQVRNANVVYFQKRTNRLAVQGVWRGLLFLSLELLQLLRRLVDS